jgi:serine/threonine protein kinase
MWTKVPSNINFKKISQIIKRKFKRNLSQMPSSKKIEKFKRGKNLKSFKKNLNNKFLKTNRENSIIKSHINGDSSSKFHFKTLKLTPLQIFSQKNIIKNKFSTFNQDESKNNMKKNNKTQNKKQISSSKDIEMYFHKKTHHTDNFKRTENLCVSLKKIDEIKTKIQPKNKKKTNPQIEKTGKINHFKFKNSKLTQIKKKIFGEKSKIGYKMGTINKPKQKKTLIFPEMPNLKSRKIIKAPISSFTEIKKTNKCLKSNLPEADLQIKKKKIAEFKSKLQKNFENKLDFLIFKNNTNHFNDLVEKINLCFKNSNEQSWFLTFQSIPELYHIEKEIGKGSFGKVYLAKQILTNHDVALKIIPKSIVRQKKVEDKIQREIQILKTMSGHPNVVKLHEMFEDPDNYYMVFEYLPEGDIASKMQTEYFDYEENLKKIFLKILKGLQYIHERSVVHRDIKQDNILLNHQMEPKIADFGISSIYNSMKPIKDTGGTPIYLAPEVIRSKGEVCLNTDVWSTGIMFFMIAYDSIPFESENLQELYYKILHKDFIIEEELKNDFQFSFEFENLLSNMLIKNPNLRYSVSDCIKHPWFFSVRSKEEKKLNQRIHRTPLNHLMNLSNCSNNTPHSDFSSNSILKSKFASNNQIFSSKNLDGNDPSTSQINKSSRNVGKSLHSKKNIQNSKTVKIEGGIEKIFLATEEKNIEDTINNILSEEEINSLKLKTILEFYESIGFPKKYIELIVTDKDNKFTHLYSCIDILFDSLTTL